MTFNSKHCLGGHAWSGRRFEYKGEPCSGRFFLKDREDLHDDHANYNVFGYRDLKNMGIGLGDTIEIVTCMNLFFYGLYFPLRYMSFAPEKKEKVRARRTEIFPWANADSNERKTVQSQPVAELDNLALQYNSLIENVSQQQL